MTNETKHDVKILRRFRRIGILTTLAVVFLIWVGGWVRSTGSGMGCPDWPKCFGVWIPPTTEAALPADYLEHYVALRKKKNERIARLLDKLGFAETADKIKNDPSVSKPETFNAYKTWTEYLNRVVGVVVGFLIFLTLLASLPLRRLDRRLFWLSLAGFIGVGFEGWLGSIVVSTNLMPSFITVHMVVAMLILIVLISAVLLAFAHENTDEMSESRRLQMKPMSLIWSGAGVCGLILIQIIIGTQVRENVDFVADALGEAGRKDWVGQLSSVYHVHRIFYLLVAVAVLAWTWRILLSPMKSEQIPMKSGSGSQLSKVRGVRLFTFLTVGTLLSEIGLGISMHKLGIPPMLQPLHLLFATVLFASAYTLTGILYLKSAVK